jgi:thioredoxin-related protein
MNKLIVIVFCLISAVSKAQTEVPKLYNPDANAKKDIRAAVKKAKSEHKYVLIQAGGNWCTWCIEFARLCKSDPKIDSVMNTSFVWVHLNTSPENKNEKTFAKYGYPQRFGFPVFIILNNKGSRIHTQNSVYLEEGKRVYDKKKVLEFLEKWSPSALDPKWYVE